jgi:hypothetical protein
MRVEVHKVPDTFSDPNFTENQNEGTSHDYPLGPAFSQTAGFSDSCYCDCSAPKIYADLATAKEIQAQQPVDLRCWRKGVGEN